MPEIGRPVTPQEMQYRQVEMGPRRLSNSNQKSEDQIREKVINSVSGRGKDQSIYKTGPHNQLGKDEFLKLLTYQLQNQDPMNPMEQNKFTGELAQFSQLEQLTALNKKFDDMNKTQGMQDKFYAASFVGKKVVTNGSTMQLKNDGDRGDVLFKLDGDASRVMIRILDEKNNIAGEIWREGMSAGGHQVAWDGVQLDGSPAVKGNYRIMVRAWNSAGGEVGTKTEATGIVQSASFEDGETVLTVNGQKVFLRDVASFHTPETQTHMMNGAMNAQLNHGMNGVNPHAAFGAAQATNSGLSGHNAPIKSNVGVPTEQAMNAYSEAKGIYE